MKKFLFIAFLAITSISFAQEVSNGDTSKIIEAHKSQYITVFGKKNKAKFLALNFESRTFKAD